MSTIHLPKPTKKNTSLCGVEHPKVQLSKDTSKVTYPQCLRLLMDKNARRMRLRRS